MLRVKARGQSTLEYVILIGFVVAALIAMGVYMKRGIQGRLKESTDQVGEQYSAGNTEADYTTKIEVDQTENMSAGGATETRIDTNKQTKSGSEKLADYEIGY